MLIKIGPYRCIHQYRQYATTVAKKSSRKPFLTLDHVRIRIKLRLALADSTSDSELVLTEKTGIGTVARHCSLVEQ